MTNSVTSRPTHPAGRKCAIRARALMLGLVSLLALAVPIAPADAQEGEVLIDGLNGPQGVYVANDGAIWVTEAGMGGGETIDIFDPESAEVVQARLGNSARLIRLDAQTRESVEVAVMPSLATPGGGVGGGRVLEHGGDMYATVGEWATPDTDKPNGISTIVLVGSDGSIEEVADTWAHELTENPYPHGAPHSHPYGMAVHLDGRLLYADAGGNALMAVDPTSGAIETIAVFDPMPGVFPRPDYDGQMLTDPVPTAVVVRDGRIFVSLLSGAPFVPGSAKVVEVMADGSVADYATGLTMLTDLRDAPDGNLYATTFALFGEEGPDPMSGSVTRIHADGSTETVVEALPFVTSLDFDDDGNAYVATNGVGPPGSGEILMLRGLAATDSGDTSQLPTTGGSLTLALTVVAATVIVAGVLLVRFKSAGPLFSHR